MSSSSSTEVERAAQPAVARHEAEIGSPAPTAPRPPIQDGSAAATLEAAVEQDVRGAIRYVRALTPAYLRLDPDATRQGLITGLSVVLAATAAFALHLDDPWWAAISAWVVSNPNSSALATKGALRVAGTLAGCMLGFILAGSIVGMPLVQAAMIFAASYATIERKNTTAYSYAWMMAALLIVIMLAVSIQSPDTLLSFAIFRSWEICLGVACATAMTAICAPDARSSLLASFREGGPKPPILSPEERRDIHVTALLGAFVVILILILWTRFELPSLVQVIVSVLACLDPSYVKSRTRGIQRISGCFVGGAAGLLVVAINVDSFLLWSFFLFLGIYLFGGLHHSSRPNAYIGTQGGIAFLMCLLTTNGPPGSVLPIVNRLAGMTTGVAMIVAVAAALALSERRRSSGPGT